MGRTLPCRRPLLRRRRRVGGLRAASVGRGAGHHRGATSRTSARALRGEAASIRTRAYLARLLTQVIFTASAQHAAVNFPQNTITSFTPAMPLAAYAPSPAPAEPAVDAGARRGLPPLQRSLLQQAGQRARRRPPHRARPVWGQLALIQVQWARSSSSRAPAGAGAGRSRREDHLGGARPDISTLAAGRRSRRASTSSAARVHYGAGGGALRRRRAPGRRPGERALCAPGAARATMRACASGRCSSARWTRSAVSRSRPSSSCAGGAAGARQLCTRDRRAGDRHPRVR